MKKFRHFALKTADGYLAKDVSTNQLEIYEDKDSAERNKRSCEVVPAYVYSEREHHAIYDRISDLEEWAAAIADSHEKIPDWIRQSARSILAAAAEQK